MEIEYFFQEYMADYIYEIEEEKIVEAIKDIVSADQRVKQTKETDEIFNYFLYEMDGVLDQVKTDLHERLRDYFYEDALTQFIFDRSQE